MFILRILILSFYYHPDLCAGSFRCTALVESLLKKDKSCTIEVISTIPNRYASFEAEALKFEKRGRLTIRRISLPTHKSGMLDQIKAFYYFYKDALKITNKKDYDLVFATSSRLFTAFLGAKISRRKNIPLYLDIRDIFVDTLKDVLSPTASKLLLPFLKLIEKYTFAKVNRVNLVSGGFLGYFKTHYPDLFYDLYTNGIDEVFIENKQVYKPVLNHEVKIRRILYAGNIGEGQGLHRVIPELAARSEGKYVFQIIGDGGRKAKLVKAVKDFGVCNVEFLPPVKRQKLIECYAQADVLFLHLNDYDAFEKVLPSKIFEYAVFNKPILAGVSGFAAEFITDNVSNAEVFAPCNIDGAINALDNLAFDSVKRVQFIREYSRKNIMDRMSGSVLSVALKK